MTRTYHITPAVPRESRLARAAHKTKAEARTLYLAARETRALYELETRARLEAERQAHDARRESLRAAMDDATVRVYDAPGDASAPADSPDWRLSL